VHLHKKFRKITPGVPPNSAKTVFFLSSIQRGLSDTYPALTSTTFEITDMNRCAGAYTHEKFSRMGFASPKKLPPEAVFWVGWGACYHCTVQTAQFQATEIISGASRHPKNVPYVHEF